MNIESAVVLITGASSGIGRTAALAFDRAGARVAIAARRRERLEEIAALMKNALVLPVDISDDKAAVAMVDRTVEAFGRIDVLINNAAAIIVSPPKTPHRTTCYVRSGRTWWTGCSHEPRGSVHAQAGIWPYH